VQIWRRPAYARARDRLLADLDRVSARELPLAGRHALVTGAASGIGRATARRLTAAGAAVVVDHLGDAEAAGVLVAEIERDGGRAVAVEADVSDEAQVDVTFARAREEFGPVDVLVNNAGREKPFALLDRPLEKWNAVLALNLTGPFDAVRRRGMRYPKLRLTGQLRPGRWRRGSRRA